MENNELYGEIFRTFKLMDGREKSYVPLLSEENEAYLYLDENLYCVVIPISDSDDIDIKESFVGIDLSRKTFFKEGRAFNSLCLSMLKNGNLSNFSLVASSFVDPNNRRKIIDDPYEWFDSWRDLFGDSLKRHNVTDVLAELIVLKHLYESDKSAKWEGPNKGTYDISLKDRVVEVKSTTNKTDNYIFVNSRFQLNPDKNESLFFVRLEAKPNELSIDSVVNELLSLGYIETGLELSLKELGYRKGSRARKIPYDVLSIDEYIVNEENFPIISLEQMNDLTKPKNIVGYQLKVDLSGIEHKTIKLK